MGDVTKLSAPANDPPPVLANPFYQLVEVHLQKALTPEEARRLAMVLLEAADEAEDDSDMVGYGYNEHDSAHLQELQSLIEEHLGWEDDEQECAGDYAERIVQVGKILKRRGLQVVK